MYLTQSNVIRGLAKQDYTMLREMCQYSNNLYNVAVYTIRQHYFDTQQFLRYEKNCHVCKKNENYSLLQAGVSQQILKVQHFTTFTPPRKLMKLVYTRPELSPLDFLRFGP